MPKKTVCQGDTYKALCENNKCKICYERSFASTHYAQYWSPTNDKTPREYFKNARKKLLFRCTECNHDFGGWLYNVMNGTWCPYCNSDNMCNDYSCDFCYNKSAASCEYSNYWSDCNENPPRFYCKASDYESTLICPECDYEYTTELFNAYRGVGCDKCINKTSKMVLDWLQQNYDIKTEEKFSWCDNSKTGKSHKEYPFDFYLEEQNILIELDGRQHFKQVSNWRSPEKTYAIDLYKMQCAIDHNISVIRLVQEEVLENKLDWKTELEENIEWCLDNPASAIFIEKAELNLYQKLSDGIDSYLFPETVQSTEQNSDIVIESTTESDSEADVEACEL
jgi:hypothetical protein